MVEYSTDAPLKKLKTAVKNKIGTTLQMNLKILELLLTTRQKQS